METLPPGVEIRPSKERGFVEIRGPGQAWTSVRERRLADAIKSAACPHCRAASLAICHHA